MNTPVRRKNMPKARRTWRFGSVARVGAIVGSICGVVFFFFFVLAIKGEQAQRYSEIDESSYTKRPTVLIFCQLKQSILLICIPLNSGIPRHIDRVPPRFLKRNRGIGNDAMVARGVQSIPDKS